MHRHSVQPLSSCCSLHTQRQKVTAHVRFVQVLLGTM
jgi:hypothetical protein